MSNPKNTFLHQSKYALLFVGKNQSYVIKSAPWIILWFRIFGIFSVEHIKRLCVFMFKTCSNSQLLSRGLWLSAEQAIGASLNHKNTQPLYMFNKVRVLHLNSLKERTWLHSFGFTHNMFFVAMSWFNDKWTYWLLEKLGRVVENRKTRNTYIETVFAFGSEQSYELRHFNELPKNSSSSQF